MWIRAHNEDTVEEGNGTIPKDTETTILRQFRQMYEKGADRRMKPLSAMLRCVRVTRGEMEHRELDPIVAMGCRLKNQPRVAGRGVRRT